MSQTIYTKITTNKKYITDGIIVISFALFAFLFFIGKLQGNYPFVMLSSDAGNVASFTVGRKFPELFTNDFYLGNFDNFRFYFTIHMLILPPLAKIAGNYSLAFAWLLLPTIFLQLLGFYVLGNIFFKNRYWALLLAIVTILHVNLNLGTYWGIWYDALARSIFQALLPFVLALAIHWRSQSNRWFVLMFCLGILVYVHSISTVVLGVAIWLGLWVYHPSDWSFRKRLGYMVLAGSVFFITIMPFGVHYATSISLRNRNQESYQGTSQNAPQNSGAAFRDPTKALNDYYHKINRYHLLTLFIIATFVIIFMFPEKRKDMLLMGLWIVGIIIASVIIPLTEITLIGTSNLVLFSRGIRYLIPVMLIVCLWFFVILYEKHTFSYYRPTAIIIGTLFVCGWVYLQTDTNTTKYFMRSLSCLKRGQLVCVYENNWTDFSMVLEKIRQLTLPNESILAIGTDRKLDPQKQLAIRYYALRPVVYCGKNKLRTSFQVTKELNKIREEKNNNEKFKSLVVLGRELDAQYLLIDFKVEQHFYNALGVHEMYGDKIHSLINIGDN